MSVWPIFLPFRPLSSHLPLALTLRFCTGGTRLRTCMLLGRRRRKINPASMVNGSPANVSGIFALRHVVSLWARTRSGCTAYYSTRCSIPSSFRQSANEDVETVGDSSTLSESVAVVHGVPPTHPHSPPLPSPPSVPTNLPPPSTFPDLYLALHEVLSPLITQNNWFHNIHKIFFPDSTCQVFL